MRLVMTHHESKGLLKLATVGGLQRQGTEGEMNGLIGETERMMKV